MSVMKASELVRRHIDVAKNCKTVYMWGCFGMPVTESINPGKSCTVSKLVHSRQAV